MALNKDYIDFLFDIMNHYDKEYDGVADNCFSDVNRALNEIAQDKFANQQAAIVPLGSYAIKNNYQVLEPMEFLCVLKSDREILNKEKIQSQEQKKKKKSKSLKQLYESILNNNSDRTAFDCAQTICEELKNYIGQEDKVYYKNNVVFLKFNMKDEIKISIIVYVGYDFDNDGTIEYTKLGYRFAEKPFQTIELLSRKNAKTNGNFLLLCKLIKMLELELILANQSNVYLSKKTLFVENLLYNVPDKFFESEDFCEIFRNVVNYLNQCDMEDILIPGTSDEMFGTDKYYANSNYTSFIKKINYVYKNADVMIDDALDAAKQQENQNKEEEKKDDNNLHSTEKNVKKLNKDINNDTNNDDK